MKIAAKITTVKSYAVMAPLARPITTATLTIPKAPLVLIDVETDQGVVGRSYLFGYTPMTLAPLVAMLDNLGEVLAGEVADPLARFAQMEGMFRLLGRQGVVGMAMAGIDMALWDAKAKTQGMTLAEALGATPGPIRCYDSHGVFDAARDTKDVEGSLRAGFDALKFKLGAGSVEDDIARLRAVQEIVGPDMTLMIDYNQSLSAPQAIRRMHRLEAEFALDWVEEPVGAEDYAGHCAVRAAIRTPVQTGENWWMPEDAARAVQAGISDHAMLDIMKIGGVTGWMRAAAIAQGASLPVSSHLFVEASANVLCATPNAYVLEHMDISSAILRDPYEVEAGHLTPKGHGLGLEWNMDAVARYAA